MIKSEEMVRLQKTKMSPPQVNVEVKDQEIRQKIVNYEQTVAILTAENSNLLQI